MFTASDDKAILFIWFTSMLKNCLEIWLNDNQICCKIGCYTFLSELNSRQNPKKYWVHNKWLKCVIKLFSKTISMLDTVFDFLFSGCSNTKRHGLCCLHTLNLQIWKMAGTVKKKKRHDSFNNDASIYERFKRKNPNNSFFVQRARAFLFHSLFAVFIFTRLLHACSVSH